MILTEPPTPQPAGSLSEIIRPKEFLPRAPIHIKRPCDWGLEGAITSLETQLGTIEAYNRLVSACAKMREQIDSGNAKEQNPLYRTSIRG